MHRRVENVKTIKLNYIESAVRKEKPELIHKLKLKLYYFLLQQGVFLFYTVHVNKK